MDYTSPIVCMLFRIYTVDRNYCLSDSMEDILNKLFNPDLQEPDFIDASGEPHWNIDSYGNQTPPGWERKYWLQGQSLPFPEKGFYNESTQRRETMPAICEAIPEDVHKNAKQLPADEQSGQPRQIIFPGRDKAYKRFGDQGALAGYLSQLVTGLPALAKLRFTAFVLCDALDQPSAPYGLEPDHVLVWLRINSSMCTFNYEYLSSRFDVEYEPGKKVERPWAKLVCNGVANEFGQATVVNGMQKNWKGPTSIFYGPMTLEVIEDAPAPDPNAELERFKAEQLRNVEIVLEVANRMREAMK